MNTADFKEFARSVGVDLVGIADLDRFEGTPPRKDPRAIAPDARVLIGLGFRVLRGTFRGIEEGTQFYQYGEMGVIHIDEVAAPLALRRVACYLEDRGWEAPMIRAMPNLHHGDDPGTNPEYSGAFRIEYARAVRPGVPPPDVLPDFEQCAWLCGLGEPGWGGFLLTPEFGPFQRFAFLLTDAPLEPDPVRVETTLCDRCGKCITACPGDALKPHCPATRKGGDKVWDHAGRDDWQCAAYYNGACLDSNPFVPPEAFADWPDGSEIARGEKPLSPEESRRVIDRLRRLGYPSYRFGYDPAICGVACRRACYAHLEECGVLTRTFKRPFRTAETPKLP